MTTSLFVTGMHRSATSAFAGATVLLGAARPKRMLPANEFNPKGYFESEDVVGANDAVLARMPRRWNEPHPVRLPDGPARQNAVDGFARLLEAAFEEGGLQVLKDPRVSLLAPLWIDAARQIGTRPVFAILLRDPAASAASIARRDGMGDEAAVALWLRYMLDAERHTRGQNRALIAVDAFTADPLGTLVEAARSLDITWPVAPETVEDELGDFVEPGLLQSPADVDTPLLDLAQRTHSALAALARDNEATDPIEALDHLRVEFDALCPEVHSRMVFDQLGHAVFRKWEVDAERRARVEADARAAAEADARRDAEAALTEARGERDRARSELRRAQADIAVHRRVQHDDMLEGWALREKLQQRLEALKRGRAEREGALEAAHQTRPSLERQAREALAERDAALRELGDARTELARLRRRPGKVWRDLVKFRALSALSRASPPLPPRMTRRFGRSAAKRDPNRSLLLPDAGNTGSVPASAPVAPDTVTGCAARFSGKVPHDPVRSNILVVSHDASRTGAPILALNLVQEYATRYNVTTLCLRGGPLLDAFRRHSVAVWQADKPTGEPAFYDSILEDMRDGGNFAFAIVNSIVSREMLRSLQTHGIPSVALLHEFASYTLPKTAFRDAILWADHAVFSTRLTLENALASWHMTRTSMMHVEPQGKCVVPAEGRAPEASQAERERLAGLLRPEGHNSERFIVIGAGYVQIRKGVDLFIDTAMRILERPEGRNALFVWIGSGYDPVNDAGYSVYLQDQLLRSGIGERVLMLPETSEIESVYRLADAMLLPSRLDPLPNVAIDAMCAGLPVLCFDQTTGIAEMLERAGLKDRCVASYLDTADMADKLAALAGDPDLLADTAVRTRDFAAQAFDFPAYAARLEALALSGPDNREADRATVAASAHFDVAYCLGKGHRRVDRAEAARRYVESARKGVRPRKPEPGFHPLVFAEHLGDRLPEGRDPYSEFLRLGRPEGPWLLPVIRGGGAAPVPQPTPALRAALHVHAYYTDQLTDLVKRLSANATRPDLFVSVRDESGRHAAEAQLSRYSGRVAALDIVPNAGRDIGPLLTAFGADIVRDYAVVGHVHTKKSTHIENDALIGEWIEFALSGVVGGIRAGPMVDRILARMEDDPDVGVVYPDDPHIMGWTENRRQAERLALRMELGALPEHFNFPVGTMFWMRSGALQPFLDLGLTWSDYPAEPLANDGTMLHALERLFGVVPVLKGWKAAVTHTPGVSR